MTKKINHTRNRFRVYTFDEDFFYKEVLYNYIISAIEHLILSCFYYKITIFFQSLQINGKQLNLEYPDSNGIISLYIFERI